MQKKVALVFLAMVLVANCQTTHESLEELFTKWSSWKVKHDKTYVSSEEESYRFQVWQENKRDIEENPGDGYTRALNMFSDLTKPEWRSMYLTGHVKAEVDPKDMQEPIPEHYQIPASVDWDAKGMTGTTVTDQGRCGSCWAFATMGTYNGAVGIKTGTYGDYSQQQLVSCSGSYRNGGCGGGSVYYAIKYMKDKSICTLADYPYVSGKTRDTGSCNTAKEASCKGKSPAVKDPVWVKSNDCNALAAANAQVPVGVSVDANRFSDYDGGIFKGCGTDTNHAVTLTGYVKDKYWKIKNSWGPGWGEKGYMRIKFGNTCGICQENFYAVLA